MNNEEQKPMSEYFAVFNCHVNNASERARRVFNKRFGAGSYRKHISPLVKRGIMSIFDDKPNTYTLFYVATITRIVNGGKQ